MKFSTALSFVLLLPALHQIAASPHIKERQNVKPSSSVALPSSTTQPSPGTDVPPNTNNRNGGNKNGNSNGNKNPGNNNPGNKNGGNNDPANNDPANSDPANSDPGNSDPGNNNPGDNNPGNTNGNNNATNDGDPQTSLTLDRSLIGSNIAQDGQDPPVAGQVPSLTSTNNFINFCLGKTITNGTQIKEGSCNPIPMGDIPSTDNMPSSKFTDPGNLQTIKADSTFTVKMAINKFVSGNFVNPQKNYYGAPQQLKGGLIQGHSHVVIQALTSLEQSTPIDPTKFEFFKGLNDPAQDGILSTEVTGGLAPGAYRMSSIHGSANHQPLIVPVAQRGPVDDVVYFECTVDGKPNSGNNGGSQGGPESAVKPTPSGGGKESTLASPSPAPSGDGSKSDSNNPKVPSPTPTGSGGKNK